MQPLVIDGGYGEGGGQIVRTALSLSAITGRPIRLDRIRARRPKPGLAAQHVTAVHALATLCDADVTGNVLGSLSLEFRPRRSVKPGDYEVDIAAARESGSAGAATLVAQAVLLPLALIDGVSHVTIHGGTHMAWSPPFDYVRDVWLPTLTTIGIQVQLELVKWGWFPVGDGELRATIEGHDRGRTPEKRERGVAHAPVSERHDLRQAVRVLRRQDRERVLPIRAARLGVRLERHALPLRPARLVPPRRGVAQDRGRRAGARECLRHRSFSPVP